MTEMGQKFAELIGQILGRRWFMMQQARKKVTQGDNVVKRQKK